MILTVGKRFWSFATLAVVIPICSGQSEKIPLYDYKFSFQIEEALRKKEMPKSRAAWYYSYLGEIEKAVNAYDYDVEDRWGFDTLTEEQIAYFRTFRPVDALDYILERSEQEQVVIVNEAHHLPLHRIFIRKLLIGLREKGYNYFGLEALSNCKQIPWAFCDDQINERGYPLYSPKSGTYIREPQMSNLIREAHRLGFEIFAYEGGKERESDQARHIAEVLKKDPTAKVLILCGFGHLIELFDEETHYSDGKLMAYYLEQFTGIDPFTINQYLLTESIPDREVPLYQMINLPFAAVFRNESGETFHGWKNPALWDVLVYHPRTRYFYGKPDWLLNYPGLHMWTINHGDLKIDYPVFVRAWKKGEPETAVPTDVAEVETAHDKVCLVLPEGNYHLKLENPQGDEQQMEIQVGR